MSGGHLDLLRTIHEFQLIADIETIHLPSVSNFLLPIKQGAMVCSFLLATVRHISSNVDFLKWGWLQLGNYLFI
jgi:hypothetical protein